MSRYNYKVDQNTQMITIYEGNMAIQEYPQRSYGKAIKYVDQCNKLTDTSPAGPYESLGTLAQGATEAAERSTGKKGKRGKAPTKG